MASILVTGGAGYIGAHVAKSLSRAGFQPVCLDNLSKGHREAVRWGPLVVGDLCDGDVIERALREHRARAVIHLAGSIEVGESMRDPAHFFHNNFSNSIVLLNAMQRAGVEAIVFSSTAAVYGTPTRVPIPEEHPTNPVNPYGESKLMVERALHWAAQAHGMRWMALRYFNAAGADPDLEIGEAHDPETHLIPRACLAAMGKGPALSLFGTDYPTRDGTAIRDYVHVSDLARAHVLAVTHLLEGGRSAALNLGLGRGHTVAEVIHAVERVSGRSVPRHVAPRRIGDPPALVADPSAAMKVLGWKAEFTELDSIVETAWRWHARQSGHDAGICADSCAPHVQLRA
ncbi:MAG TPA: UDP-glucose 4-epimerase GalE [Alphaproteobacteria bacterium]